MMFSGFWGWFLVVVIVAVIFGAGKLPELKKEAEDKMKTGLAALEKNEAFKKGKEELQKLAEKAKNAKVTSAPKAEEVQKTEESPKPEETPGTEEAPTTEDTPKSEE